MGGGSSTRRTALDDGRCEVLHDHGSALAIRRGVTEGLIPAAMRGKNKAMAQLPCFYAPGLVSWWVDLRAAQAGEQPAGVIPKGSALYALEQQADEKDRRGRTYVRFIAEVDPQLLAPQRSTSDHGTANGTGGGHGGGSGIQVVAWLKGSDGDGGPGSARVAGSGRGRGMSSSLSPSPPRAGHGAGPVAEGWARVPAALSRLREAGGTEAGPYVNHPSFAATLVDFHSVKNVWAVPTLLGPPPESKPALEQEADAILATATKLFQEDGDAELALAAYEAAAQAASQITYMVRTREEQLTGQGQGTSFRKSTEITDRSIHTASEGSCWRAVEEFQPGDEDGSGDDGDQRAMIKLACGMWLPKAMLVIRKTPLDQLAIRALATAGMLAATLELYGAKDKRAATIYQQFLSDEGICDFVERPEVANVLAAYKMAAPQPATEQWEYYRVREGYERPARHPEDLALEPGAVVAVAPAGQHNDSGWWEGATA
jgi:hypothetical protein